MPRTTMFPALVTLLSLATAVAACGGTGESTTGSSTGTDPAGSGGSGAGGQTMTGGNGGAATTGGTGGAPTTTSSTGGGDTTSGTGGSQSSPDVCLTTCQSAADCASDDAAYSANNYACQGGGCIYTGCTTNAECTTSAGGQPRVCTLDPTYSLKFCATPCQGAADCALDDAAYSANNYACQGGGCVYTGCATNAECTTSAGGQPRVCTLDPAYSIKYCTTKCQTASDCAYDDAALSADNYACLGGGCIYVGCTSDAECITSASGEPRVCGPWLPQ